MFILCVIRGEGVILGRGLCILYQKISNFFCCRGISVVEWVRMKESTVPILEKRNIVGRDCNSEGIEVNFMIYSISFVIWKKTLVSTKSVVERIFFLNFRLKLLFNGFYFISHSLVLLKLNSHLTLWIVICCLFTTFLNSKLTVYFYFYRLNLALVFFSFSNLETCNVHFGFIKFIFQTICYSLFYFLFKRPFYLHLHLQIYNLQFNLTIYNLQYFC